jgi:type I pantothenate kinase
MSGAPRADASATPQPPATGQVTTASESTPFVEILRSDWARLAPTTSSPLTDAEIVQLRGIGDRLDMGEVAEVYLPLSRLLSLYVANAKKLHDDTTAFLGGSTARTPFVIGVAGSVAVGKSTVARLLRELMARWPDTPRVELVTTDGFLYPNAELERRGIMARKGFPESYDRRALLRFITEVKSGRSEVRTPVYSHMKYDIVEDAHVVVRRPDVLIVEGLNVLQPAPNGRSLAVSDLFDFSIYVDARTSDIAQWYEDRFMQLQQGAFANPNSYFNVFTDLTAEEARKRARLYWTEINEPNLVDNIRPTKARAKLVLRKDSNHSVSSVLLRKV